MTLSDDDSSNETCSFPEHFDESSDERFGNSLIPLGSPLSDSPFCNQTPYSQYSDQPSLDQPSLDQPPPEQPLSPQTTHEILDFTPVDELIHDVLYWADPQKDPTSIPKIYRPEINHFLAKKYDNKAAADLYGALLARERNLTSSTEFQSAPYSYYNDKHVVICFSFDRPSAPTLEKNHITKRQNIWRLQPKGVLEETELNSVSWYRLTYRDRKRPYPMVWDCFNSCVVFHAKPAGDYNGEHKLWLSFQISNQNRRSNQNSPISSSGTDDTPPWSSLNPKYISDTDSFSSIEPTSKRRRTLDDSRLTGTPI